tara:strand:+ start:3813 stop:4232 length:420 start_codon:yes stop_codon:yes gene_type:complete
MDLKRAEKLYRDPNPLWDNAMFVRFMRKREMQKVFIESEIEKNYKKEKGTYKSKLYEGEGLEGEYLSMGDNKTSIVLADTQILEKCINMLNESDEDSKKEEVIRLLEAEIQDIDELEKELKSEGPLSEILVQKIIVGNE